MDSKDATRRTVWAPFPSPPSSRWLSSRSFLSFVFRCSISFEPGFPVKHLYKYCYIIYPLPVHVLCSVLPPFYAASPTCPSPNPQTPDGSRSLSRNDVSEQLPPFYHPSDNTFVRAPNNLRIAREHTREEANESKGVAGTMEGASRRPKNKTKSRAPACPLPLISRPPFIPPLPPFHFFFSFLFFTDGDPGGEGVGSQEGR